MQLMNAVSWWFKAVNIHINASVVLLQVCVHIQDEPKITREAEAKDKLGNKHDLSDDHIVTWRKLEMKKRVSVFFILCMTNV